MFVKTLQGKTKVFNVDLNDTVWTLSGTYNGALCQELVAVWGSCGP